MLYLNLIIYKLIFRCHLEQCHRPGPHENRGASAQLPVASHGWAAEHWAEPATLTEISTICPWKYQQIASIMFHQFKNGTHDNYIQIYGAPKYQHINDAGIEQRRWCVTGQQGIGRIFRWDLDSSNTGAWQKQDRGVGPIRSAVFFLKK